MFGWVWLNTSTCFWIGSLKLQNVSCTTPPPLDAELPHAETRVASPRMSARPNAARLCEYRTVDLLTLEGWITTGIQVSYRLRTVRPSAGMPGTPLEDAPRCATTHHVGSRWVTMGHRVIRTSKHVQGLTRTTAGFIADGQAGRVGPPRPSSALV